MRVPSWVRQQISQSEANWMSDLIREAKPKSVVEIGVGSGWSSAVILNALFSVDRNARLTSFDRAEHCNWDMSRRIGEVTVELVGNRAFRNWTLYTGKTSADAGALRGHPFDFAFIDACHLHPWPSRDLLNLLPILIPRSWVVFHDINLPKLNQVGNDYGAKVLFENLQGVEKIVVEDEYQTMGAIRIPERPEELVPKINIIAKAFPSECGDDTPSFPNQ